jgi:hypothetical protein
MNSTKKIYLIDGRRFSLLIRYLISTWLVSWLTGTVSANPAAPTYRHIEWTREQRTSAYEHAYDVSADRLGNVFITGETEGPLSGSSLGLADAFLSRYDSTGVRKWTINIGSNSYDVGNGVSADNLGNVYVAGGINRHRYGNSQLTAKIFIQKYDIDANLSWSRSFDTGTIDEARDVVVDGLGNVFVTGWTLGNLAGMNAGEEDVFVSKFNTQGDLLWTRQIGTNKFDNPRAAAADGLGNVYITGVTTGLFGGIKIRSDADVFLAKFDADGNHLWTRQIGNQSSQWGYDIDVDGTGNVYVAGLTEGNWGGPLGGGNPTNPYDGYLVKFNSSGDQQWLRQFGGPSYDNANGVAVDSLGNVYVSGQSYSNLPGTNADGNDAYVMKFSASGAMQWITQGGPPGRDESFALAADGSGNLYSAGSVDRGNLPFNSDYDLFVAKIVIPEPTAAALLLSGLTCMVWVARKRKGARPVR